MKKKLKRSQFPDFVGGLSKLTCIMKLTLILILLNVCVAFSSTYSQQTKFTLSGENVSIRDVLSNVESKSEYRFFFNNELINLNQRVNYRIEEGTIFQLLDQVLLQNGIQYEVKDRTIILSPKSSNEPNIAAQQQHSVSGKVTDPSGAPLPGVSVVIKGTSVGVITDVHGSYSLANIPSDAVLIFSFVGMKPNEVAVAGKKNVNVAMEEETFGIEEVVAVGYGTQRKSSLTSAITTVDTDQIQNRSVPNLTGALQGITPGLFIRQASGRPGASPVEFDIRGASRNTFSSNPALVIIDGMPGDYNTVNPADVESISILKDAGSAAIYGARSTGGVVLITTKKAKGAFSIDYDGQVSMQQSPILNNLDFLNTAEFMRFGNVAAKNDADATGDPYVPKWTNDQISAAESGNGYPKKSEWTSWIPKSMLMHNHNLTMSGNEGKLNYYTNIGYLKQEGLMPNDNYNRNSIQLNLNYLPTKRLEVDLKVGYYGEIAKGPIYDIDAGYFNALRGALLTDPTIPFKYPNGKYNHLAWAVPGNPLYLFENAGDKIERANLFRGNLNVNYEFIKDLKLKISAGSRLRYTDRNRLSKKTRLELEDGSLYQYYPDVTSVGQNFYKAYYYNTSFILDYKKIFGNHNLYGMIGYTEEKERNEELAGSKRNFINSELRQINASIGTKDDQSVSAGANEWALASFIGRFTYDYNSRYLFEFTARRDGSSRFSPGKKYAFFPSFSAGWRITEEEFLHFSDIVSNLKVRASYGKQGNQGKELYPTAQKLGINTAIDVFGSSPVTGVTLGSPVNENLSWETKTTTNIGLDYGFFKDRLTGTIDVYNEMTDDIITTPSAPAAYGASAPIINAWSIQNKGFEFVCKWSERKNDFTYSVGFNLSNTNDKIKKFQQGNTIEGFDKSVLLTGFTFVTEGRSQNELYGYKSDGLYVSQAEIDADAFTNYSPRPGEIKYVDVNNDGKINSSDMRPLGKSMTPHWVYGASFSAEYKGFDFSMIINGVGSRWNYRQWGGTYMLGYRPGPSVLRYVAEGAWSVENPDKHAEWTRPTNDFGRLFGHPWAFDSKSEWNIRNYKYLRVKNLQFGYTLPSHITDLVGIKKARIYFTGENLFTFAPGYKEPVDPEADAAYSDDARVYLGPLRTLSLGLSVTF